MVFAVKVEVKGRPLERERRTTYLVFMVVNVAVLFIVLFVTIFSTFLNQEQIESVDQVENTQVYPTPYKLTRTRSAHEFSVFFVQANKTVVVVVLTPQVGVLNLAVKFANTEKREIRGRTAYSCFESFHLEARLPKEVGCVGWAVAAFTRVLHAYFCH